MLNICIEPLLCASAAEDTAEKTGKKTRLASPGESQPEQEEAAYHMEMVTSASSKSRAGKGEMGSWVERRVLQIIILQILTGTSMEASLKNEQR